MFNMHKRDKILNARMCCTLGTTHLQMMCRSGAQNQRLYTCIKHGMVYK